MSMMNQQIFDKVAQHLLMQGRKSVYQVGIEERCAYRGNGGDRCAIGCLIPDDLYSLHMEGLGIVSLLIEYPVLREAIGGDSPVSWSQASVEWMLLDNLQRVHDGYSPSRWAIILRETAEQYKLSDMVIGKMLRAKQEAAGAIADARAMAEA